MGMKQQFDGWREDVEPLLSIKREEFHELGYNRVTKDELWNYAVDKLRRKKEFTPFYAFVDELLSIQPQGYMTWLTVHAYKEPIDWFKTFEQATAEK